MPDVLLRTSERRDFKRCPQRWWWGWREGLRPVGSDSDALWFGTLWHMTMAYHYSGPGLKRGKDPLDFWASLIQEEIRFIRTKPSEESTYQEEKYVLADALGVAMLTNYFATYGSDSKWSVIEPEKTFRVKIPYPGRPGKFLLVYVGTYDLVYRDEETGELWLGEHKTAKAIQLGHLPLDDQAGSYWATAAASLRKEKKIGPKEELQGIMYNFARKALPDERPRNEAGMALNKDGSVSKVQPAKLLVREPVYRLPRERDTQIARIGSEGLAMKAMRDGVIPLYKNPTRDCGWDCSFYAMCQLHEQGGNIKEFKQLAYKVEDPYADHRKSAGIGEE